MAKGKQVWFRGNKAAQKYTEAQAEDIYKACYDYVINNKDVILKTEVEVYAMETYGIGVKTLDDWRTATYKNNISILHAWDLIDRILETRVVKDQDQMRPTAQNLVMRNKHNYQDKAEIEIKDKGALLTKFEDISDTELKELARKELGLDQ